jgi:hypothetical protein
MNHHVRERAIFVETSPALIRRLEEAIDALIAMRDSLDGDADAEDGDDAEEDRSDYEPSGDEDEPTLGAPERCAPWDRSAWARGSRHDGEAEITVPTLSERHSQDAGYRPAGYNTPDDCEPVGDDEPSLGSPEWMDQRAWGWPLSLDKAT